MMNLVFAGTIVGVVLYLGKALMIRLILGKRFHRWITSTAVGLGIMDLFLTVLGGKVLASVHAEGVLALVILVSFGACTTIYICTILAKRKAMGWWHEFL